MTMYLVFRKHAHRFGLQLSDFIKHKPFDFYSVTDFRPKRGNKFYTFSISIPVKYNLSCPFSNKTNLFHLQRITKIVALCFLYSKIIF